MTRYYAELTTWQGQKEKYEISPDWIDNLVDAVEGQYLFVNNEKGFTIDGKKYAHIDVYSIDKEVENVTR